MNVNIKKFVLGPLENNTYIIQDLTKKIALVIDPSVPSRELSNYLKDICNEVKAILITHAHFDHIGGVNWLRQEYGDNLPVFMHEADLDLWEHGGGAREFGFELDIGLQPNQLLNTDQQLSFGDISINVLYTPGHSPGHVTFYLQSNAAAFCGDLIFKHGVGRTDLIGSSENQLVRSIQEKIFTLPEDTVLYPGHGSETTVGEEKKNNPFL